ncbi:super-infection exclusion protein B [Myroides odoratimimus]|uniref:super-infection exclusion protein B n=1 Tax=Myroides odoratimimus TaxID=76832 RepID=UPI003D2F4320
MMSLDKVLDFLKLKPKYYFVISAITGIILFLPEELNNYFEIELKGIYKTILGVCFIASLVFWVFFGLEFLYLKRVRRSKLKELERKLVERLRSLTKEEFLILNYFYVNDKTVVNVDLTDGVIQSMCNSRLLDIVLIPGSSSYMMGVGGTPVKINDLVRKHIVVDIVESEEGNSLCSFNIID